MVRWPRNQGISDQWGIVEGYTEAVGDSGAGFTKLMGIFEVIRFLQHVLGVEVDPSALSSPLIKGRMRKARLNRVSRNQAGCWLQTRSCGLRPSLQIPSSRFWIAMQQVASSWPFTGVLGSATSRLSQSSPLPVTWSSFPCRIRPEPMAMPWGCACP